MASNFSNFRLDRIENLELLTRPFTRLPNFRMQDNRDGQQRNMIVRALFDMDVARWVHESRSYYTVAEEETPEGLMVTLKVRQESEVLQWLLSWGLHVRVLEPESLRKRLLQEAAGMLRNHQHVD